MGTCNCLDVFLVRHGITDWNLEKRYLGHTDREVIKSELTRLDNLKNVLATTSFDSVYTSDLRRCLETLAYIQIPAKASIDTRLREINFGDWEGKNYQQLKDKQAYRNWIDNWENNPIPNGETASQFKARIDSFFNLCLQQQIGNAIGVKKRILIMTHGGVIRYLVSTYVPSTSFWDVSVKHGQATRLTFKKQKGEWLCSSLSAEPFQEKER
ncbi:histidine phosphatase family protein [Virgibacillus byunsanensis]|uniref:Histidine phosphatase family protein n=1 Tax=Virgibacillus byunsanensis TaxID=570945 RepID=A0ABW3LKJ4_9BACI